MFFRAQNLGPLRDAEVDLSKNLIVLAGPNNSGKTYLAWSVYGLHRFRFAANAFIDRWVQEIVDAPEHSIDVDQLFAQDGPALLEAIAGEYKASLHLCFAADSDQLAGANVSLRGGSLLHGKELSAVFSNFDLQRNPLGWSDSNVRSVAKIMVRGSIFPACILFPAERIAVNIFAKELALKRTELVDEMVDADLAGQAGAPMELVRRKAGRYPWPIRDSLRVAGDLANLSKDKSPFAALADELESAVLGGGVSVSDAGEMLFSPLAAADRHLEMHLTASVVKSLSSLVFYFRHLAAPGDFIIVDEPELNLHPDNQRKITRLLAKAVRLGFKVMMSTHSDYVLRELNHLIMLSKLPESEAAAFGYDPMSALDPGKLGVYLFDDRHAEPVEVGETGFSIRTIDAVVNQLNADEQRLYARLSDG